VGGTPLTVLVNGETRSVPAGSSLAEVVESLGLVPGRLACEVNGAVVPRARYPVTLLKEGDRLEVVRMIGGG
jgi:sulfur carrier protein